MNDLISLVVPVYNVEKYIDKCIKSIIDQTYVNIEIILVDDGSTDSSGLKCDFWAEKDTRINVIHKKNGGLSDARNFGINVATGKYISFIDSDDFVSNNYVDYLYGLIKKYSADISICDGHVIDENGVEFLSTKKKKRFDDLLMDPKNALKNMLYGTKYSNSAWAKMYSLKLFEEVKYPVGKYYEDIYTTYKLFLKSKKIVYGCGQHYFYVIRKGSISNDTSYHKRLDAVYGDEEVLEFAKNIDKKLIFPALYKLYRDSLTCIVCFDYDNLTNDEKIIVNELWQNIKITRIKTIFSINTSLKYKFFSLTSFLGKKKLKKLYLRLTGGDK